MFSPSTSIFPAVCANTVQMPTRRLSGLGNPFRLKKRGRAYSLLEVIIVIAIIAGVAVIVFNRASDANNAKIANDEASDYSLMSARTRTMYASQGDFTGLTPKAMIGLGLVPRTMVNGDNIRSRWNTQVDVAPTNLNGTAGDGVEFSYTLPRTVCADFVNASSGISARVTVGGTVVKNVATGNNNLNISDLEASCQGGSGGNVTVLLAQGR